MEEKGTIDLATVTDVRMLDTPLLARASFSGASFSGGNKGFRFEIITPKRTFLVEAANPHSRTQWVEAIRKVVATNGAEK